MTTRRAAMTIVAPALALAYAMLAVGYAGCCPWAAVGVILFAALRALVFIGLLAFVVTALMFYVVAKL